MTNGHWISNKVNTLILCKKYPTSPKYRLYKICFCCYKKIDNYFRLQCKYQNNLWVCTYIYQHLGENALYKL